MKLKKSKPNKICDTQIFHGSVLMLPIRNFDMNNTLSQKTIENLKYYVYVYSDPDTHQPSRIHNYLI